MKTLSVTSRVTTFGSVRVSASTSADRGGEVRRHELGGGDVDADLERLVLVVALPTVQVHAGLLSTQRPISTMSPDCSASGTMVSGATIPRMGCAHRSRASTPVIRPSAVATIGWYSVRSSRRAKAPRRSRLSVARLSARRCSPHVDHPVAGAALALGLVHGGVGVLEDLFGDVVAAAGEGDADAGADLHLDAERTKASASASSIRVASGSTCDVCVEVLAQDDELVAGQAGQGVAGRSSSVSRRATATSNSSPTWWP